MRPRIGIARAPGGACAEAIAEAGGEPVELPGGAPVVGLAGLLIPGGPDFLPEAPYPEDVRFNPAPAEQLARDRGLLAAARDAGLPILGVCYGMQLLAVEGGGALHYHLPIDLPGALEHRLRDPEGRHRVALQPGTRLASLFGTAEIAVNSRHHQAVSEPGAGLLVAARAEDGVIEAIEVGGGAGAPFVVGVQWHPEDLEREHRSALFGALVEAARRAPRGGPRG